jgi:hypothetical protein
MNDDISKPNYFVRVGIVVVVVYIAGLVVASFRHGQSPFEITSGIIALVTMLILLVLAEGFNSISFGSILRLKREVAKAEEEKKEAKVEVRELRSSLLTLATNVQQSQVTTNISGMDVATLRRVLGVVEATPEEKEKEKEAEEEKPTLQAAAPARPVYATDFEARRRLRKNVEDELFLRFSAKYGIPLTEIRREVKFEAGLEIIDPIMNRTIIYDGYVRSASKEYFLHVGPLTGMSISLMISDRLYVPLAKVFFYRQLKKVDAEMVLLYPILPLSPEEQKRDAIPRILQWFQPAISNNLLRVEGFSFTEKEFEELKKR